MPQIVEKRLLNPDGSAKENLGGFETEYGVSAILKRNRSSQGINIASEVVGEAFRPRRGPYGPNVFLEDADREYIDVGYHPEVSCAEDVDVAGMAFRVARGHVKMAERFREAQKSLEEEFEISQQDVDIAINVFANTCGRIYGQSWASHLNLLTSRGLGFEDFTPAFLAHNAAKIVWSGVGTVLEGKKTGSYKFALSEKAGYIFQTVSLETTHDRPLVNLRDRPLANIEKYRRVHDISGETNMNPFVSAMRAASGSIILRACELGVKFDDLVPEDPVKAIKEFSLDPSLKHKVRLENGLLYSGLDIEEALICRALTSIIAAGYFTPQQLDSGIKLINLFDDLRRDPLLCMRRVDWVVKRGLIEKGLEVVRKSGETDYSVAWAKALDYHRVFPEGAGMRMLRAGKYELSPTEEMLEEGVPLPPTRAALRGDAIGRMRRARRDYSVDWDRIKLNDQFDRTVLLKEPYDTHNERLSEILEEVDGFAA